MMSRRFCHISLVVNQFVPCARSRLADGYVKYGEYRSPSLTFEAIVSGRGESDNNSLDKFLGPYYDEVVAKPPLGTPRHRAAGRASLRHPHPERVTDSLFHRHRPFFDPRDLVQVKYEMLRARRVDKSRVVEVARRFGLSRQTFYFTDAAFRAARLRGLLPDRPGPKGPHKVTPEIARFLRTQHQAHPEMAYRELAEAAAAKFGTRVHPRTVRRVLAKALFPPPRTVPQGGGRR